MQARSCIVRRSEGYQKATSAHAPCNVNQLSVRNDYMRDDQRTHSRWPRASRRLCSTAPRRPYIGLPSSHSSLSVSWLVESNANGRTNRCNCWNARHHLVVFVGSSFEVERRLEPKVYTRKGSLEVGIVENASSIFCRTIVASRTAAQSFRSAGASAFGRALSFSLLRGNLALAKSLPRQPAA